MTLSMRDQRVRVFALTESGEGGWTRPVYAAVRDAWARVEPPSGADLTRFEGSEHSIAVVMTFGLDTVVPTGALVRVLPGLDGLQDYRAVACLPRRMLHELHVYGSSLSQDEKPHEVADIGPIVVTPGGGPVQVHVGGGEVLLQVRLSNLSGDGQPIGLGNIDFTSLNEAKVTVGNITASFDENGQTWTAPLTGVAAGFTQVRISSIDDTTQEERPLRTVPVNVQDP